MSQLITLVAGERELAKLEARRKKLVESIMEGAPGAEVKDELIAIAARREELQRRRDRISELPPLLHPEMAVICRAKVTQLAKVLQQSESRSEATEALRGDAISLIPDQGTETLQIELRGNLAAMLGATRKTKRSSESDDLSLQVSLVAGGATGATCSCGTEPRNPET